MKAAHLVLTSILCAMPAMSQSPDSIVLERTQGVWRQGHAYRVSVNREGVVHFRPDAPDRVVETSHITDKQWVYLSTLIRVHGILDLPDVIHNDSSFGRHCVTDATSATLEIFLPGETKRIQDYQGCLWAPFALRDFEMQLDSISGVPRHWTHVSGDPAGRPTRD